MNHIELPGLVTMGSLAAWDLRSEGNVYRYALGRCWNPDGGTLDVTAMNPSKARFDVNDPTLLKLVHFAKQEGCGSLLLRNLAAYSATDPRELGRIADPIGPRNAEVLDLDIGLGYRVAAWGNFTSERVRRRLLPSIGIVKICPTLMVFGVNKSGEPKHVLYLKNATRLVEWSRLVAA